MPSDLWYFYESDLSKRNLNSFVRSLPNHLKRMFEDSFGGFNFVDTDVANVLQGYRGPHITQGSGISEYLGPSNGLQEVRYWYGISKNLMLLPMGLLAFAVNRAVQNTDWHSLYFDSKTGECLGHSRNEAIEKLNNRGHQLLREGKYTEAAQYFKNAYLACSSGYKNEAEFRNNRDRAEAEVEAVNLSEEGDKLFSQGKYSEAASKYQEAYDKSHISKEYGKYRDKRDQAKAEVDAINLSEEGDKLFSQGKYSEAASKYQEAYDKSHISKEYGKYRDKREKAKAEIDAVNFNSEGDSLFNRGKYAEALGKYLKAYDKSQVHKDKFTAKRDQAKAEVDAINLSGEGDNLFSQGKYDEAISKHQAAYDKSLVAKEKTKYAACKNNAQALKNKLSILDTLWKKAWEAENDIDKDRSREATELFQKVLSETKDAIKSFPGESRFKQYEILISLKIDGNELFNEGLELQQDGAKLSQEAQELKMQLKFELARIKYTEAKSKFFKALEKFEIGKEKDKRFVSCVEFVQGQLNEILQSIEVIEQHTISSKLLNLDVSMNSSDHSKADSCQGNTAGDHNNYYEQI